MNKPVPFLTEWLAEAAPLTPSSHEGRHLWKAGIHPIHRCELRHTIAFGHMHRLLP